MKIQFVQKLESGYVSLADLCNLKGWMNGLSIANIPPEYTLVTDGEYWNVKK